MYSVNGKEFDSYLTAVAHAKSIDAEVFQIDNGLCRWAPAPKKAGKMTRHVLINKDGSETLIGRTYR